MPLIMQRAQCLACTKADGLIGAASASRAGTAAPAIRWRVTQGNQNMLATLVYEARTARVRFDRTAGASSGTPRLASAYEARLS